MDLSLRASVEHAGSRNLESSNDFNHQAKQLGVVDLTSNDRGTSTSLKRKALQFSTPGGKRSKNATITVNLSRHAITLQTRWDQGVSRWVHKGQYTPNPIIPGDNGGPQNGELCVLKEFKSGSVYEECFFNNDVLAVEMADSIVKAFNDDNALIGMNHGRKSVLMITPAIWEDIVADESGKKRKKLVEPMLEGTFQKFNSNSGYVDDGADFMQGLSHFSYHHTGGKFLLCDLQGGHYDTCYILTDPVVMSMDDTKQYGATDFGSEGISNFFARHKCTRFCRKAWAKPNNPRISSQIPCLDNTSMSLDIGKTEIIKVAKKEKLADMLSKKYW